MDEFEVERLDRANHLREAFCCGKPSLDEFLRTLVSQYEKRKLGKTFVLVKSSEKQVFGYYTLASGSIPLEQLPTKIAKKLPKHPIPVALLARLAVDQSVRGQGLGRVLLTDALERVLALAKNMGIYAVEVHALDKEAQTFYLKYGFIPLEDNELHLFLPLSAFESEYSKTTK